MLTTRLLDTLSRAGYRLTRPRAQVAELIGARQDHFTAAELLHAARRQRLGLGRATVFRALDTFTELGVVERLDLPNGEHAYVACAPAGTDHHHHVICQRCGRSAEIGDCGVDELTRQVERRTGYRLDRHRVELYGLCEACATRSAATE